MLAQKIWQTLIHTTYSDILATPFNHYGYDLINENKIMRSIIRFSKIWWGNKQQAKSKWGWHEKRIAKEIDQRLVAVTFAKLTTISTISNYH